MYIFRKCPYLLVQLGLMRSLVRVHCIGRYSVSAGAILCIAVTLLVASYTVDEGAGMHYTGRLAVPAGAILRIAVTLVRHLVGERVGSTLYTVQVGMQYLLGQFSAHCRGICAASGRRESRDACTLYR
jgi:hypothetical protein